MGSEKMGGEAIAHMVADSSHHSLVEIECLNSFRASEKSLQAQKCAEPHLKTVKTHNGLASSYTSWHGIWNAMSMPAFPQKSKTTNPFDLDTEPTPVHAPMVVKCELSVVLARELPSEECPT